jgi:hypothetical protein
MIALWRRTAAGPRWLTAGGALLRPTLFLYKACRIIENGSLVPCRTASWKHPGQGKAPGLSLAPIRRRWASLQSP